MLDGRHTGTGGGNHVTLGGADRGRQPAAAPARPAAQPHHLLAEPSGALVSLLGMFIGPTSQSPRVDEARDDALYELEIAFEQLEREFKTGEANEQPWLVDRILRNFLVDLTGNTHRAEFSIDKLYAPGSATGRLGLLEFRAFEMPPHARMSLLQILLLRALVARFWTRALPRAARATGARACTTSSCCRTSWRRTCATSSTTCNSAGYAFRFEWFAPFLEFRFPRYGTVAYDGIEIELRQAIEPWHVLGEAGRADRHARATSIRRSSACR